MTSYQPEDSVCLACQTTRLLVSIVPRTDNYWLNFDYKYNILFNVLSTRDPEEGRKV